MLELQQPPEEAYTAFVKTIENVNVIVRTYNDPVLGDISLDPTKCYCGNNMLVTRLKYDLTRYKKCHCGANYGYTIYKSGTWLAICSDIECFCTHEVNQKTKLPLGYPANEYCKSLRLIVHSIMKDSGLSKEECYQRIQTITGKSKDDAHMAKFRIEDCIKCIVEF
jgi:hypothetical protein